MDVYVYTCKECLHFNTDNCPWKGTKEESIAGECFAHNVPTTAWDGTSPERWSAIGKPRVTAISSGAPIAIADNSGTPVNVVFNRNEPTKSYREIYNELCSLRKQYNDLSQESRKDPDIGGVLIDEIKTKYSTLIEIEMSIGRNTKDVKY